MYTVFSHPLTISYKASLCSKITVFYFVTTILTILPPLLIAYRSQGFWQKIDTYEEQPDIHFDHELIVQTETSDPDNSFGWSSMPNFNTLLGQRVRTPTIKVKLKILRTYNKFNFFRIQLPIITLIPKSCFLKFCN